MEQGSRPAMSNDPQTSSSGRPANSSVTPSLVPAESSQQNERNWLPIAIASVVVLAIVAAMFFLGRSRNHTQDLSNLPASPDAYATSLRVSDVAMSESSNLAGGKVTYLDGHLSNLGDKTVSDVVVEVTFRDYANKVAQSQRVPLTIVRMREPYIDTAPLSTSPLKPGSQVDFRLNFDSVSPDWAGNTPEIQVLHVVIK